MSDSVVTVEMDDTLRIVKEIFDKANFHHLLVVESKKLVGVLSQVDLYKSLSPNIGAINESVSDAASLNKKVHQIMTRKPYTLNVGDNVYDAIDVFNKNSISCIPIIDNENKPVGIISWRDILKTIKNDTDNLD